MNEQNENIITENDMKELQQHVDSGEKLLEKYKTSCSGCKTGKRSKIRKTYKQDELTKFIGPNGRIIMDYLKRAGLDITDPNLGYGVKPGVKTVKFLRSKKKVRKTTTVIPLIQHEHGIVMLPYSSTDTLTLVRKRSHNRIVVYSQCKVKGL